MKILGGGSIVVFGVVTAISRMAAKDAVSPLPMEERGVTRRLVDRDATGPAKQPAKQPGKPPVSPPRSPVGHRRAPGDTDPLPAAESEPLPASDGVPGDPDPDGGLSGDPQVVPVVSPGDGQAADPRVAHERRVRVHRLRWHRPGLCDGDIDAARDDLQAGFAITPFGDVDLHHDPDVPRIVLDAVAEGVDLAGAGTRRLLARRPYPPAVWVYRTQDQMLAVSCSNTASIAYFDGAIHISGELELGLDQIQKSVRHEYVHHVLLEIGVPGPMWFQEGVAMYVADETWWRDPRLGLVQWLQRDHLPFAELVEAFPHTAEEQYALTAYFQSLMMVLAVVELRGEEQLAWLSLRLAEGSVLPEDAFIEGLAVDRIESAWSSVVGVITR